MAGKNSTTKPLMLQLFSEVSAQLSPSPPTQKLGQLAGPPPCWRHVLSSRPEGSRRTIQAVPVRPLHKADLCTGSASPQRPSVTLFLLPLFCWLPAPCSQPLLSAMFPVLPPGQLQLHFQEVLFLASVGFHQTSTPSGISQLPPEVARDSGRVGVSLHGWKTITGSSRPEVSPATIPTPHPRVCHASLVPVPETACLLLPRKCRVTLQP